ncbi:uncharacterized protein LOC144761268 [Lissotriton helveticus]
MALQAKESNVAVDPDILAGWTQRAICLLGNANCALSTERRKSLLMRMDSNLTELASAEPGPLAEGNLFGDRFVKDVSKYVGTFTSLDKAQSGIKRVFHQQVFNRAGRGRGRSPGRFANQGPPRGDFSRGRGDWDSTRGGTFYPTRGRFNKGRFQGGGNRAGFHAQNSAGERNRLFSHSFGGSHETLHSQLGSSDPGCVGLTNCMGFSAGVLPDSPAEDRSEDSPFFPTRESFYR